MSTIDVHQPTPAADTDGSLARGVMFALPVSAAMWVGIYKAVSALWS